MENGPGRPIRQWGKKAILQSSKASRADLQHRRQKHPFLLYLTTGALEPREGTT